MMSNQEPIKPASEKSGISEFLDLESAIKAASIISSEILPANLIPKILKEMIEISGAQKALLLENTKSSWEVVAKMSLDGGQENYQIIAQPLDKIEDLPLRLIKQVQDSKELINLGDARLDKDFSNDPYIQKIGAKSVLCLPIEQKDQLIALILLENHAKTHTFTQDRVLVLKLLGAQAAISLENARHFEHTQYLYNASERYVPKAFLKLLGKEHVEDVNLGDCKETTLTALFTDVRDYTTLSEKLTPHEVYALINKYLEIQAPIIRVNRGFICQYQGDGIMAFFPNSADDAVNAVLEMSAALVEFNKSQTQINGPVLKVGYGLNTGPAMLGTLGDKERMGANVISDAVNLASTIESLNKLYGTEFLISDTTMNALTDAKKYPMRLVDKIPEEIILYQVYNKSHLLNDQEQLFIDLYEEAFKNYEKGNLDQAIEGFKKCQTLQPAEKSSLVLIERCQSLKNSDLPKSGMAPTQ